MRSGWKTEESLIFNEKVSVCMVGFQFTGKIVFLPVNCVWRVEVVGQRSINLKRYYDENDPSESLFESTLLP